jgi:acyl dehydratase
MGTFEGVGITMKHFAKLQELQAMIGQELGQSGWITVDQQRIDLFAQATGDHQWIHVDPERAAKGPFGKTIAHGFLTLSLLPELFAAAFDIGDVRMGVNYGLNKVRFTAPVPAGGPLGGPLLFLRQPAGGRVRGRFVLREYLPIDGGAQLTVEALIELEGSSKPACIAETVSRRYT